MLALATADTAFAFDALSKPQLPPKPSATKSGSGTAAPAPSAQRSQPSASSDKTVTVTGIVRDEAGKPMSGVGVIVKGMLTGTVTGTDGSYALKARPNDELSFSFLGYKTQEVFVGSKSTIDITLVDEAQAIDGVVVTLWASNATRNRSATPPPRSTVTSSHHPRHPPTGSRV